MNSAVKVCTVGATLTLLVALSAVVLSAQAPDEVVATISVSEWPISVAFSPDSTLAYVSHLNEPTVKVVRVSDHTVVSTISLGEPGPEAQTQGLDVTPDGQYLYAVWRGSDVVVPIRTADGTLLPQIPVCARPMSISITPDGRRAYVACYYHAVDVIDMTTNTVIDHIDFPQDAVLYALVVSPDGTEAYLNDNHDRVYILRTSDNSIVDWVPVGPGPHLDIDVSPDGATVYTTASAGGTVEAIRLWDRHVDHIYVGGGTSGVAVTPDGQWLYVSAYGTNRVSVIRTSDNAVVAQIPVGQWPQGIIDVSPDGRYLYCPNAMDNTVSVIVARGGSGPAPLQGRIAFCTGRDGNYDLYVMDANGDNQAPLKSGGGWHWAPDWSPDGTQVAYYIGGAGVADIYVRDLASQTDTRLTWTGDASEPRWSPDGTSIAFNTLGQHADIHVMRLDENLHVTDTVRLTDSSAQDASSKWSPDGSQIAFVSDRSGYLDIWVMDVFACEDQFLCASEPSNLTNDAATEYGFDWSPDGTRLAVTSTRGGYKSELYIFGLGDGSWLPLTSDEWYDMGPSWAPDGEWIAYYKEVGGGEIYVINVETGVEKRLTVNDAYDSCPDWWIAPHPDTTPPTTTILLDGTEGTDGWFVSPVTVTLSATDNPGGSGVAYSEYTLDGGPPWTVYTGPFTIGDEGTTTILARSADNAGNREDPPVTAEVAVDLTAPAAAISELSPNPANVSDTVTLLAELSDALSGVQSAEGCVEGSSRACLWAPLTINGQPGDTVRTLSVTVADILAPAQPPDMPTARARGGAAAVGSTIYVLCGHGGGWANEALDVPNNTWTVLKPFPEGDGRYSPGVVALDGLVYVIGGTNIAGNYNTNTVDAYDPASDSWSLNVGTYPHPVSDLGCTTFDGAIYCFGGSDYYGNRFQDAYRFDSSSWSFHALHDMPTPRTHPVAVTLGNTIYVIGGDAAGVGATSVVEAYDPAMDDGSHDPWTTVAPMPVALADMAAGVINDRIYVAGGSTVMGEATAPSPIFEYDPQADQWYRIGQLQTARTGPMGAVVGGRLYVIGGQGESIPHLASVEIVPRAVGPLGPGVYTVKVRGQDLAGNWGEPAHASLVIREPDTVPPTSTISLAGTQGNDAWFVSAVTVTLSATDNPGGSGIAYTEYSLDDGESWTAYTEPFTIADEGTTTILARSADNAGNVEDPPVSEEVKIDFTPPTIVGSRSPDPNANGWNNEDVAVHFDCYDGVSGIASCTPDTVLSSEGEGQSVIGIAVDLAGNTASTTVTGINIDKTAPAATASASPQPNPNGWNNADVTVTFSGLDNLSGIDNCSEPAVLSSEGAGQSASGTCTDGAGNVSAPATASDINIDKTTPQITATRNPVANQNGWDDGEVSVHFDCEDALSGIESCPPDPALSAEGAGQSASGTAVDMAGNSASTTVSDINIDLTDPTITGNRAPVANSHGWNNQDVTVRFDCSDALSGIASCTPDAVLANEGEDQSVTGSAMDLAGNAATTTVSGINIDLTAPTVNITGLSPNPARVSELAELVAMLSDQLSGIQSAQWCAESESLTCTWEALTLTGEAGDLHRTASANISGLPPGVYSIKAKTQDLADNVSDTSQTFLVVYDPSGGFVTGGGWIIPNASSGDFLPGISGRDKANFGFVAKYKKGASTPEGQVEFHYQPGDFNLHSSEMHWLIINGNRATFQGLASINLHPDRTFRFRVDCWDGQLNGGSEPDTFILKVWYDFQDPNTAPPVYRASGSLAGGNIIIHTK